MYFLPGKWDKLQMSKIFWKHKSEYKFSYVFMVWCTINRRQHLIQNYGGFTQLGSWTTLQLLSHSLIPQPPSDNIHLLHCGVLHRLQCGILFLHGTNGLQRDSLLHLGPLHRPQRNLCSGTWSTSYPSSTLTFLSARLVLTALSPSCCCTADFFFPSFLNILSQRHK